MGTVFSFDKFQGTNGNPVYISGGRAPAEWTGQATVDCGQGSNIVGYDLQVGVGGLLVPAQCFLNFVTGFFGLSGAAPPSTSIQASGFTFSASQGMPVMNVYTSNQQFISQVAATSVSPDGTSATFPFPTKADGTALGRAHYVFNLNNQTSPGVFKDVAASGFSIGSNDTSRITPYGVAAIDVTTSGQNCIVSGSVFCSPVGPTTFPAAIVTLSSKGQVIGTFGSIITVGSQPTAIKAYATATKRQLSDPYGGFRDITQPSRAIVTNFGSNSASVVDLFNNSVVQTISVGTEPIAIALRSDETKAYAANYGSSSVSEVDLTNLAQSRVAAVGAQPAALAMDPSGTALWVGGLNYISKIDLTGLSVVQTFSVSGQVTSIAVSSGQNALVYTVVQTSFGSTTFQAQQASLTTGVAQGSYAQYTIPSSSSYLVQSTTTSGAPAPPGWLMANGALVSAPYGNRFAAVGTPTGFAVLDLQTHLEVLQGATPSAVRGIATDPANGIIYMTAPESNSLMNVPFPPAQ